MVGGATVAYQSIGACCPCRALSSMMVVSWAVGDAYKLVYYTVSDVPYQFMYCGVFQFCTDTFILFQMFVLYVPGRPVFDLERYLKKHIR